MSPAAALGRSLSERQSKEILSTMKVTSNLPCGLYIGGEWVGAPNSEYILNPATEQLIAAAPVGSVVEAGAAIAAARAAFDGGPWPTMSGKERKAIMTRFYEAISRRRDDICQLLIAEAGAVRSLAYGRQFDTPVKHLGFAIGVCDREVEVPLPVEVHAGPGDTRFLGAGVIRREPIGVVAVITAYNYPFYQNIVKAGLALAMGCTVVLKPSPYTPFSALILGEIAEEAGLPRGVLNVITGGQEVGEALTRDARVDMVTFTGSDTVGAAIQAQCANTLKRTVLELGGKSALIVRPDADLNAAARSGLMSFTMHAGQGCALTTRHLVHNSIRERYVELLAAMTKGVRVGDPADPASEMGPLIREAQRRRTESYVEMALAEGAKLVAGGKRPDIDQGYFYLPTLFDEVDNHSRIAREEVFGPVGVVIGYDTDDEAIAIANDSEFGLAGGIFTADAGRAFEIARQIRTGGVAINGGGGGPSSYAPFGGIKRSGYGREGGLHGLDEFTYTKTIQFHGA